MAAKKAKRNYPITLRAPLAVESFKLARVHFSQAIKKAVRTGKKIDHDMAEAFHVSMMRAALRLAEAVLEAQ